MKHTHKQLKSVLANSGGSDMSYDMPPEIDTTEINDAKLDLELSRDRQLDALVEKFMLDYFNTLQKKYGLGGTSFQRMTLHRAIKALLKRHLAELAQPKVM